MNMQGYETALEVIKNYPVIKYISGPQSGEVIDEAENILSFHFPSDYKKFLLDFGSGGFGNTEIYGIVNADLYFPSVPNAIWYTMAERKKVNLPKSYLIISDFGNGEIICLDIQNNNVTNISEARVISYWLGYGIDEQPYNILSEDFGSYFLHEINNYIEEYKS